MYVCVSVCKCVCVIFIFPLQTLVLCVLLQFVEVYQIYSGNTILWGHV